MFTSSDVRAYNLLWYCNGFNGYTLTTEYLLNTFRLVVTSDLLFKDE